MKAVIRSRALATESRFCLYLMSSQSSVLFEDGNILIWLRADWGRSYSFGVCLSVYVTLTQRTKCSSNEDEYENCDYVITLNSKFANIASYVLVMTGAIGRWLNSNRL
jgi:hypothetical protein